MKCSAFTVRFHYSLVGLMLGLLFLSSGMVLRVDIHARAQEVTPTPQPTRMPLRLQAQLGQGWQSAMETSGSPVRGVGGDGWADVVIGQPNFRSITPNEVAGNKLFNPGGMYVDRSVVPNRVYVYDSGNSRVLGFSHLGTAQGGSQSGQPCTSNSDHPGSVCIFDSTRRADIVLGQPSFASSACNGDSGMQDYPNFPAPSKTTLCGLNPAQISIGEGGSEATMASDPQGNFYVPDVFNNRVLRYNNPFTTDAAADYVWGQADFASAACNRGASYGSPTSQSLCLAPTLGNGNYLVGVAIDSQRNLWVTDTQNNRVLRFPYNAGLGAPDQTANLVLGQPNFTSANAGTAAGQMTSPASIRVDGSGNVYVIDGFAFFGAPNRILIFRPPLSNGMSASQIIQSGLSVPRGLELDAAGGLWVSDPEGHKVLRYDASGNLQQTISGIPTRLGGGLGVDRDRNVMLTGWDPQEALVYTRPAYAWTKTFLMADQYGSMNREGGHGFNGPMGLAVTASQLVVGDGPRMLFWNRLLSLTNNYPSADGVIGQPDFKTRPNWTPIYGRMQTDNQGKLWVIKGYWFDNSGAPAEIDAFQLPLTTGASPVLTLTSPLPLKGGGTFSWSWSLVDGGIAYQPDCDCLWLSDRDYSRVFRIRNIRTSPVVDIVLGQTSLAGVHCNQGRDSDDGYVHPTHPTQDSLCAPGGLAIDRHGNLYVSDDTLEIAGNWRLLEYDAAALPGAPASAVYGIPASRVYGRNGSFTEPYCQGGDPMCAPWEPAFYPNNDMVIGFNTYLGTHFPQIYHDPLTNSLPYSALQDYFSHAFSARLDPFNDLYVLDHARSRVLIYWAAPLTISGNTGLAGATLTYLDGTTKTAVADGSGNYSFNVRSGWSGTVTPSAAGYGFWPLTRTYSAMISDQTGQDYAAFPTSTTSRQSAANDGWILESGETTNTGGSLNSSATTFTLGDDSSNRQYRSILSFGTGILPDSAVVQSAVIKIKQSGAPIGTNPFSVLGKLIIDIRKPYFGTAFGLQLADFNAPASAAAVGAFGKKPAGNWYSATLNATGRSHISTTGPTQLRLRFSLDDNNDHLANLMSFFSGNALAANRPVLVIQYFVP